MKKVLSFFVALMATTCAFAQPEAGTFSITPKVGANMSTITNGAYNSTLNYSYNGSKEEFKVDGGTTAGFAAGAEASYQASKSFALTAGLIYSQQGAQRDGSMKFGEVSAENKDKLNLAYLNIPILANVYLFKGFAVKAGIQPGFLLSAKQKSDNSATGFANGSKEDHEEHDCKDYFNSFDFAIPVGISYEFSNIIIDARYNIGITDVYKSDKIEKNEKNGKNGVFQLTVGYKINL